MSKDEKQKAPTLRETIERITERQNAEIRERNKRNAAKSLSSSKTTTATVSEESSDTHGLTAEQKAACDRAGLDYETFAKAAGNSSATQEMTQQERDLCDQMGITYDLYKEVSAEIEAEGRGPMTSTPKPAKEGGNE